MEYYMVAWRYEISLRNISEIIGQLLLPLFITFAHEVLLVVVGVGGGGVGVLLIIAYTGRLRSKGVSFSGFRYMKG